MMIEAIQTIDWAILHWINNTLSCGLLDFLMPVITSLGNIGGVWLLAAVLLIASGKYRKYGIALLIALAAGFLIGNVGMKNTFMRPRPCWIEDVPLLISMPTDYSFPSGHTLGSVIAAVILTAANRKFGLAAIPLAVLIAFSRLYLYVHFPSDVLASVVLGLVIGSVAVWVVRHISRREEPYKESRKEFEKVLAMEHNIV